MPLSISHSTALFIIIARKSGRGCAWLTHRRLKVKIPAGDIDSASYLARRRLDEQVRVRASVS